MRIIRYWLPVAAWMTIIFTLSSQQSVQVSIHSTLNFIVFKTLHVIEYAFLYLLCFRAFTHTTPQTYKKSWFYNAFIITVLYAITDEIHQTFVPTREGRARDVIIDTIGASLAWIFLKYIFPKAPKKLQHWVKRWELL